MKIKNLVLLIFASLLSLPSLAQYQAINGQCSVGNTRAATQGLNSTNILVGNYPSCTVTVYLTGTSTLATIYSTTTGSSLSNPFTAGTNGLWTFYTGSGGYDVVLSGGSPLQFPSPVTIPDVAPSNSGLSIPLPISEGGTGATTSPGALTNLGIPTPFSLLNGGTGSSYLSGTAAITGMSNNGPGPVNFGTEITSADINGTPQTASGVILSNFTQCSANPVISPGSEGTLTSMTVRDPTIWEARGQLWVLYTFATNNLAPYGTVTLGLAHTADLTGCTGWIRTGQVVTPSGYAGAVFSPSAYYTGAGTDNLYVYVSIVASASQWYSGPSTIAMYSFATGVDWTVPSNWVNPTSAILTGGTQTWEGTQGLYAPSTLVPEPGGTYNIYYSSSNSGSNFFVGVATATSPTGPFTKYSGNPVLGDGDSEEPSCGTLNTGQFYCFTDDSLNELPSGSFRQFISSDPNGLIGWTEQSPYTIFPTASWYAGGHLGAMGQFATTPTGYVMVSNGSTNAASNAVRSIGIFNYTAAFSTGAIGGLIATGAGTCPSWGSTFTVCNGVANASSIGIGGNGVQSGNLYWSPTGDPFGYGTAEFILNTAGDQWPVLIQAGETRIESLLTGGLTRIGLSATSAQFGGVVLGDIGSPSNNVGMYRGQPNGSMTSGGNILNLQGYSGVNIVSCTTGFGSCAPTALFTPTTTTLITPLTINATGASILSGAATVGTYNNTLPAVNGTLAVTPGLQAFGTATLASGITPAISTTAACSPSSSCVYEFTHCGVNSSTTIGTLNLTGFTPGTSFTIISLTAAGAQSTGDQSTVCWRIN